MAATIPARMSPPCSPIAWVMSANTRSESVSPATRDRSAPSRSSSQSSEPTTPLWANARPSSVNGWVLSSLIPPVSA